MSVHSQIQEILDNLAKADLPPMETLSPEDARVQMEAMVKARGVVPDEVGSTENLIVPGPGGGIPARLYRPLTPTDDRALPTLVYFHGGGHVLGNPDTHDGVARTLCNGGQCAVLSINYRKAPEHKFPAAAEDAYAAILWVHQHGAARGLDPERIAVGGDSAGGNLAAVAALMARDDGLTLRLQLLVYPVVDYACIGDSYDVFGQGYGVLTDDLMRWFQRHYLNDEDEVQDWRASPIHAESHAGVAPALVITAECDVLHDDGRRYAEALQAAGVEVTHTDYAGMIHTFFAMPPEIEGAAQSQAEASAALRRAFA